MAKATEKPTTIEEPGPVTPGPETYQALIESNGEAWATMIKSSEAMLTGMASLGSEVMSFASDRLQQTLKTTENLTHCKDFEQAFRVQCDHAQAATQPYLAEATKIMELATGMARDSMTPFEERTRETLRRLNGDH